MYATFKNALKHGVIIGGEFLASITKEKHLKKKNLITEVLFNTSILMLIKNVFSNTAVNFFAFEMCSVQLRN